MNWNELAPWLALVITIAISILVPLFTQIANNNFQLKMHKTKESIEKEKDRINRIVNAYESFLINVGECVGMAGRENITKATASLHRLYIYAPDDWWEEMDKLCDEIREYNWNGATITLRNLSKKIAIELDKYKA